jgi:hypothetical protein
MNEGSPSRTSATPEEDTDHGGTASFKYPKYIFIVERAMSGARVGDAGQAQAAARRYLTAQFGSKNIKEVSFSKSWYTPGAQKDIWEVEGELIVKKGWFGKEEVHFKFQIDPATGRVIAYEV